MIFATSTMVDAAPKGGKNHGCLWTQDDHAQLRDLFCQGASLSQICLEMGRSGGSIIPKLLGAGLIVLDSTSGDFLCKATENDPVNQPQENINMNAKTIETVVLIQGQNAASKSDDEIFKLIAFLEGQADTLSKIQAKPKKLALKIDAIHADIAKLVKYVDERE